MSRYAPTWGGRDDSAMGGGDAGAWLKPLPRRIDPRTALRRLLSLVIRQQTILYALTELVPRSR
jgi:hypothetical protein